MNNWFLIILGGGLVFFGLYDYLKYGYLSFGGLAQEVLYPPILCFVIAAFGVLIFVIGIKNFLKSRRS